MQLTKTAAGASSDRASSNSAPAPDDPRAALHRFGLVDPAADLTLVWTRRQRHDTALIFGQQRHWFVKRQGLPLRHGAVQLDGERTFHRLLDTGALPTGLDAYVPRLDAADATTLVCLGLADHAPAGLDDEDQRPHGPDSRGSEPHAQRTQGGRPPLDEVGGHLGAALAMTHATRWPTPPPGLTTATCPVTTFGRISPETLGRGTEGLEDLVRLMQADPATNARLRTLRRGWHAACLTHGDIKLDNVLVAPDAAAPLPVAIIDWELAGIGDPLWDCGSFLGSLYHQAAERLDPGMAVAAYQHDGAQVSAAVRSFWTTYTDVRAQHGWPVTDDDLDRVLAWAGYWIIQRIALLLPLRRTLDAHDIAALHVADTLLANIAPDGPVHGQEAHHDRH